MLAILLHHMSVSCKEAVHLSIKYFIILDRLHYFEHIGTGILCSITGIYSDAFSYPRLQ